jgi:ACR3 family arsenite efflux pump ArsB
MDEELKLVLISAVSYLLLFVLIFGLAGTVEYTEFRKQFKEWRAICVGFFGQFVMLPFLGFCSIKVFGLTKLGARAGGGAGAAGLNATLNATNGGAVQAECSRPVA